MICYFDSDNNVNLSFIDHINTVRPLTNLKKRLSNSQLDYVHGTNYTEPGMYVIEVSKHVQWWCAKTPIPGSSSILEDIPDHVISAVKNKKLRIVILAIIEGDNYVSEEFDGYRFLNDSCWQLGLPKKSVLIISGNLNAGEQYQKWCEENNEEESIEFIGGIEWDGKESWAVNSPVMINTSSKDFNSLNRAHRPHRTEHLFFLAEHRLLDNALVSGGIWFDNEIHQPKYQQVEPQYYESVLRANYPRTIDLSIESLKTDSPNTVSSLSIYENSFLSVVTESHFSDEGGLFITEKTIRPMAVGHPFMSLGQPNILKKLNEFGFKTEFEGLDTSYDSLHDNAERFIRFHKSLIDWIRLPNKSAMVQLWESTIKHNFEIYKNINFKKIMFDRAIESTKNYFTV